MTTSKQDEFESTERFAEPTGQRESTKPDWKDEVKTRIRNRSVANLVERQKREIEELENINFRLKQNVQYLMDRLQERDSAIVAQAVTMGQLHEIYCRLKQNAN